MGKTSSTPVDFLIPLRRYKIDLRYQTGKPIAISQFLPKQILSAHERDITRKQNHKADDRIFQPSNSDNII